MRGCPQRLGELIEDYSYFHSTGRSATSDTIDRITEKCNFFHRSNRNVSLSGVSVIEFEDGGGLKLSPHFLFYLKYLASIQPTKYVSF
jgi:hypothetical protein